MNAQPTRIQWIDALKGLGISLIVLGHIWALNDRSWFYDWLFAFHVPLFFFAAGLSLNPHKLPTVTYALRRTRQLLTPYFIYALLGYLLYLGGYLLTKSQPAPPAAFDYGLWTPLFGIFEARAGEGRLVNSPLWFLPALLIALVISQSINRRYYDSWCRFLLTALIGGAGLAIADRFMLPFSINAALIAVLFLQAGYEHRRLEYPFPQSIHNTGMLALIGLLLSMIAPAMNGSVDLAEARVNNPLLYLIFSAAGITFFLNVAKIAAGKSLRALTAIGRYSLVILVIHMPIIKVVKVLLGLLLGVSIHTIEGRFKFGATVLVVSTLLMLPTAIIIRRWLPWTLGMDFYARDQK
jgi:fucose 4-O-acetylase-like acetyltransferase